MQLNELQAISRSLWDLLIGLVESKQSTKIFEMENTLKNVLQGVQYLEAAANVRDEREKERLIAAAKIRFGLEPPGSPMRMDS